MKRLVVIAASMLLFGADCEDDYAPTTRIDIHAVQAIKDWKAQGLPWSQNCSPYQVYLHWVPQDDLPGYCGAGDEYWGCLRGFDIYAASEAYDTVRADYIVEHELRHWLVGCQFGTIDGAHAVDAYWYYYRGVDIRE